MKAYIVLEVNGKEIKLTITELLELREQLNALTGLSAPNDGIQNSWDIHVPSVWSNGSNIQPYTTLTTTAKSTSASKTPRGSGKIMFKDNDNDNEGNK